MEAEYLVLTFFGITIIASISKKSLIKGLISGCIGLLLGTIGQDPVIGRPRLTFDSVYLLGGISIPWLMIGFYAIMQSYDLIEGNSYK